MQNLPNLLGLTRTELKSLFLSIGEKPYRADQVCKWIYQRQAADFANMTDINKSLRENLAKNYVITAPEIVKEEIAGDGTIKWLMDVGNYNFIETVYIPERTRATLCISSQVGCIMNCTFCSTATQGFNRNLNQAEIIGQLWRAQQRLGELPNISQRDITNVVMMGMGEPLLNMKAVLPALHIMRDDFAYGLSKRRVTVSTSGVVPSIYELAKSIDVALAVSLHAPNDELRSKLVPINRKYPIKELIAASKAYLQHKANREKITIEYVMLNGVNDNIEYAKQLVQCLSNLPCKINLIPFNLFPGTSYTCSDMSTIIKFAKYIEDKGMIVTIRKTRGQDIAAACGQLVGDLKDKTKRQERFVAKLANANELIVAKTG